MVRGKVLSKTYIRHIIRYGGARYIAVGAIIPFNWSGFIRITPIRSKTSQVVIRLEKTS